MNTKWFDIQFFAEGTPQSGNEGATGVGADDAGQQPGMLESLGVPAELRAKWAESKKRRGLSTAANEPRILPSADADGGGVKTPPYGGTKWETAYIRTASIERKIREANGSVITYPLRASHGCCGTGSGD